MIAELLGDAVRVARKDLLIEWRTRVTINQVIPLGLLVEVVFAFAFDANRSLLEQGAPGLFWVGVLFAGTLVVQRSFTVEGPDGITDALRLSGFRPGSLFLGKAAAVFVELVVLEAALLTGVVVLFDVSLSDPVLLVATTVIGTAGFALTGAIYGALSLGVRVRETLLPLLLIPVVAPILLGGSRALEAAFGISTQPGWNWVGLLTVITGVYAAIGLVAFGPLMEES